MINRDSPRRTRLLASGLLLLTFAVGGLAGAATDRAIRKAESNRSHNEQSNGREARNNRDNQYNTRRQWSVFFSPGIFDSLGATPQQKQAIEAILDRRDREVNALYAQIRPSVEAVRRQTWAEMKAQL